MLYPIASYVFDVGGALVWWEALEEFSNASPRILNGTFLSFAQEGLQLGEDLLDRVILLISYQSAV